MHYGLVDALNLVFHIHVQLAQAVNLVRGGLPVTAPICFQEGSHKLSETVWVHVHQTLLHFIVIDEGGVGFVIYPVVNLCDKTDTS